MRVRNIEAMDRGVITEDGYDTELKAIDVMRRHPIMTAVIALAIGLFLGRSSLFGYSTAEECVMQAKTRYAVGACYDAYPRAVKPAQQ